jgi:hypothetical protein
MWRKPHIISRSAFRLNVATLYPQKSHFARLHHKIPSKTATLARAVIRIANLLAQPQG